MEWIFGICLVIGLIYGVIVSEAMRKIFVGLVGLVVIIGVVAYFNSVKQEKRAAYAKTLIQPSELEVTEAKGGMSSLYFNMTALVKNNSKFELNDLAFTITLTQCREGSCNIIGQGEASDFLLSIPPGQVRKFNGNAYMNNLPDLKDGYSWSYEVKTITAKLDRP